MNEFAPALVEFGFAALLSDVRPHRWAIARASVVH
jgi:hypothetical protein